MKYLHEFRDPAKAQALLKQIEKITRQLAPTRPIKIMEICGGHTHAIFKSGLESLLPEAIELVHGPGCPVCIMPRGKLDEAIAIVAPTDVTLDHALTMLAAARVAHGHRQVLQQCPHQGGQGPWAGVQIREEKLLHARLRAARQRGQVGAERQGCGRVQGVPLQVSPHIFWRRESGGRTRTGSKAASGGG